MAEHGGDDLKKVFNRTGDLTGREVAYLLDLPGRGDIHDLQPKTISDQGTGNKSLVHEGSAVYRWRQLQDTKYLSGHELVLGVFVTKLQASIRAAAADSCVNFCAIVPAFEEKVAHFFSSCSRDMHFSAQASASFARTKPF